MRQRALRRLVRGRFVRRRRWSREPALPVAWGSLSGRVAEAALDAVDTVEDRATRMRASAGTRRGTRKRALPLMAVGFAALASMFTLVSQDVLAVNFTTADTNMGIYTNYVQGVSAAGFLATNSGYSSTSQVGVAEVGFKTAVLSGLCAIAQQNLPLIGNVSIMIMAGAPVQGTFSNGTNTTTDGSGNPIALNSDGTLATSSTNVTATNLFLNATALNGYGNLISGLNLGQSANTVATGAGITWPAGQTAPTAGAFGLEADHLNVGGMAANSYGINLAGQISLPKLKIKVLTGAKTQADCPTQATS